MWDHNTIIMSFIVENELRRCVHRKESRAPNPANLTFSFASNVLATLIASTDGTEISNPSSPV